MTSGSLLAIAIVAAAPTTPMARPTVTSTVGWSSSTSVIETPAATSTPRPVRSSPVMPISPPSGTAFAVELVTSSVTPAPTSGTRATSRAVRRRRSADATSPSASQTAGDRESDSCAPTPLTRPGLRELRPWSHPARNAASGAATHATMAPGKESVPLRSSHAVARRDADHRHGNGQVLDGPREQEADHATRPGVGDGKEQAADRRDLPDRDVEAHPRGDRKGDRRSERSAAPRAEEAVRRREGGDGRVEARQPGEDTATEPAGPGQQDSRGNRAAAEHQRAPGAPTNVAAVGARPAARNTVAIATARLPSTIIATATAITPAADSSGAETPISE